MILTPQINQSGWGGSGQWSSQSCRFVTMACPDQGGFVNLVSTARSNTFTFDNAEKHSHPKSGQDLDSDKPRCTTSCQGGETN